jgi:hypothetical protein
MSSVLFTAILAAASRFFLRELHSPLLAHAQTLLNRATSVGECETGIIQALLILVYWKSPTDRTAWLKIGMSVRMGYQLGWHEVKPRTLPSDETLEEGPGESGCVPEARSRPDPLSPGSRENLVL